MIYASICLTLIVILLSLHFLAKIKTEMLGSFYRWITILVLLIAGAVLVCQLTRGVGRMLHHGNCNDGQCTEMSGERGSMKGHKMGGMGADCPMMGKCGKGEGMGKNCKMGGMGMNADCPMMDKCGKGMSKAECMEKCKSKGMKDCCSGGMINCPMHGGSMMQSEDSTAAVDGK